MEDFKTYEYDGLTYKVYRDGTIVGAKGKLKTRLNKDGYLIVTVGSNHRTTKTVHRIVAELFIPNPNNLPEVNHKDCDRSNAKADNLEWVSRKDNVRYSSNQGKYSDSKKGFKNGKSAYTIEEVLKIRELYDGGMGVMDIIKEMFPTLTYHERKNKWNAINGICKRVSYEDVK